MNRQQAALILAMGLGAVIAVFLSPWSPLVQRSAPQGHEGQTWSPYAPRVPHYARGGLYHPPVCGEGRTALILHGWDWIASPPSEVTGPGVTDAS